jgi:hypothetical protein
VHQVWHHVTKQFPSALWRLRARKQR